MMTSLTKRPLSFANALLLRDNHDLGRIVGQFDRDTRFDDRLQGPRSQDRRQYRAIWISDIHLGTKGCRAEFLIDFLRNTESEMLYLVGDIVDGWRLRKSWFWPESHNQVVHQVLRKARSGTRVIYVPGNHDEALRGFGEIFLANIHVTSEALHVMADGRRFLVLHGDDFDGVVKYAKWLAYLGDQAYTLALAMNRWFNHARRILGYPYWSLSAYLKHKVKNAVEFISHFEDAVAGEARLRNVDGVICGHIHHAEIRNLDGVTYCNDGDWVESCTALVEHLDGRLEILHWPTEMARSTPIQTTPAAA